MAIQFRRLEILLPILLDWSPQTRANENKCESPYYYFDGYWKGMRRTHFMSGSCVIDYGTVSIIPSISLNLSSVLNTYKLNYSNEYLTLYYYSYYLSETNN